MHCNSTYYFGAPNPKTMPHVFFSQILGPAGGGGPKVKSITLTEICGTYQEINIAT